MNKEEVLCKILSLKELEKEYDKIVDEGENEKSKLTGREILINNQRRDNRDRGIEYLKSIRNAKDIAVAAHSVDVGIGYLTEMRQDMYVYFLDGNEIAWYTEGKYDVRCVVCDENLKEMDEETAKNILNNRKVKEKLDNIEELKNDIDYVENKIRSLEKEIQRKTETRGLFSRLFGNKKFDDKINGMKADIEKFKNLKEELLKKLDAFEALVVFVSDEEVKEYVKNYNEITAKLKEIYEEEQRLKKERSKLRSEQNEFNDKEKIKREKNKEKQKEVLKELVDPKNEEVINEIANNPEYGKDVNEIAKKVLKAAGLGEFRINNNNR